MGHIPMSLPIPATLRAVATGAMAVAVTGEMGEQLVHQRHRPHRELHAAAVAALEPLVVVHVCAGQESLERHLHREREGQGEKRDHDMR